MVIARYPLKRDDSCVLQLSMQTYGLSLFLCIQIRVTVLMC